MRYYFDLFKSGVLGGACISLAGYAYLTLGGIIGAVMFAFGLLAVCYLGLGLYTGKAGIVIWDGENDYKDLLSILIGNVAGCVVIGALLSYSAKNMQIENVCNIISNRATCEWYVALVRAFMCGLVMEVCVYSYRKHKTPYVILFGVPLFILCGFYHSIADSFYYSFYLCEGYPFNHVLVTTYVMSVIGNFLGCNMRRLFMVE